MADRRALAADRSGSCPDGEPDSRTNQIWGSPAIAYTNSNDDANAYAKRDRDANANNNPQTNSHAAGTRLGQAQVNS